MVKVRAASLLLVVTDQDTGEFTYVEFEKVYESLHPEQQKWLLEQWIKSLNVEMERIQGDINMAPIRMFWEKNNA